MTTELEICRFLNDAPCAYSMTYDEGFIEVLANAYPIHQNFGFPGHLDVVASQLGQVRNCFRSSLNGYFHMGTEHLKFLISEGWSVGNHSWSHYVYPDQPGLDMHREIVFSKRRLEDLLEYPITHFTIPNDVYNYAPALPYIKEAGYLSCQNVDGGVNYDDADLLKLGNFMVASGKIRPRDGWPETLLTENLTLAAIQDGWLCETTHLVQQCPIDDWKNVTMDALEARFAKIREVTEGKVWAATPVDVVDYILMRRNTSLVGQDDGSYELAMTFPSGVRKQQLTFKAADPENKITEILAGGEPVPFRRDGGEVIFTIDQLGLKLRRGKNRVEFIGQAQAN